MLFAYLITIFTTENLSKTNTRRNFDDLYSLEPYNYMTDYPYSSPSFLGTNFNDNPEFFCNEDHFGSIMKC